jgi:hypothetical protein
LNTEFVNNKKFTNMGLRKGQTNNPAGRPRGKPNKTTDELRALVQQFIEDNIETLQTDFDKLDPAQRITFIDRLLKHVLPPALHELQRLTDDQLDELINRLKDENKIRKIA